MLGTYSIPKVDVNFAATLQSSPGAIITANYIATNAQIQPSLGRPLSGGAANATINLVEPGTLFGDRLTQVDLRFSKPIRFGARRLSVNLDIYNALNANPIIQVQQQLRGVADAAAHHGSAAVQAQRTVRLLGPVASLAVGRVGRVGQVGQTGPGLRIRPLFLCQRAVFETVLMVPFL